MLSRESMNRTGRGERVSDAELGVAALLIGIVVLLTTIVVPIVG